MEKTLTDSQKRDLIQKEPTTGIDKIIKCIQNFKNLELDDFKTMAPDKKQKIQEKLNSYPNPQEQEEWKRIEPLLGSKSQNVLDLLDRYIRNWEGSRAHNNHVDEAWKIRNGIVSALEAEKTAKENEEWGKVETIDRSSLIKYLRKYPDTIHKTEIDDDVWSITDKENINEIQEYVNLFKNGEHTGEANALLKEIANWNNVKSTYDIFQISNYLKNNPTTPFIQEAENLLLSQKEYELQHMKDKDSYEPSKLKQLINEGIITEEELIDRDIITEGLLNIIMQDNGKSNFDMDAALDSSKAECKDGYTDVYLFGVPSTGKTCVLMGLSNTSSLHIDLSTSGGDYAKALKQYADAGKTVDRTRVGFVTTLEAVIGKYNEPKHKINLIEMSGEDFLKQIVEHPNHECKFEEMGTGATELLKNNNHKVFFLIIDPNEKKIRVKKEKTDKNGKTAGIQETYINQSTIIQKMVDIFKREENREIMKKVDAIHIIATKSDKLGNNEEERNHEALRIFNGSYKKNILDILIGLCEEYNINTPTKHHPKLFTFSLGNFWGARDEYYEYDETDSEKLVKAIKNATQACRKEDFWDKFKKLVN